MALPNTTGHLDLVNQLNLLQAAGTLVAPATATINGTVKRGAFVAAAAVPFADLTAAANAFNALRTSLINSGALLAA